MKKRGIKNIKGRKEEVFYAIKLTLPPRLYTCSFQVPFRRDEENGFIILRPSV